MKVKLRLSVTELDECAALLDKRVRKDKKTIEVDRALIAKLVADHSTMYAALQDLHAEFKEKKT